MLILHNGIIHTLDRQKPNAEAIAIEQHGDQSSRVLALGSVENLQKEFPKAVLQNLEGRVVLPGLTDAHVHVRQYAHMLQNVNCDKTTQAECVERVRARAAQSKPGAWILGHGWRQNGWPEGFGDAAILDKAAPRNPVYLSAASMHAAWVNSAAMKAAGINAKTPAPPNGQIQRDQRGEPTGILFEAAMELATKAIAQPTPEEDVQAFQAAQKVLWSYGLTGLHDFDRARSFRALQTLRERGELKLRVLKNLPIEYLDQIIAIGLRSGFGDDLLRIGAIKVFADGALGPRTAAMFEPYAGEPKNRGMLFVDSEELLEWGQQAANGGLGMTVHAIGDHANHEVLNAFEQLRAFERDNHLPARRHRIEHVQVLHPDDLHKLGQLELVASMQPIHATSDMDAADKYWGDRVRHSYGWKAQLESGAILAFGSDAPVESPNPWLGIHAAVTRQRGDSSPGSDGWIPEQRISLREALDGFIVGPAFAAGMEKRLGRLALGYLADLVVLEQDPFEVEPQDLQHIKPLATMVGGDWVWRS